MNRKPRQPRPIVANPVALAIELAAKLSPAEQAELTRIAASAFTGLRTGREPKQAWCALADVLNIAEQLADIGICSDAQSRGLITAGQQALASLHQRHAERASWTLRVAELRALDDAVWIARVQIEHCAKGELERAVAATRNKVRQALAGNAPAGALVCG